jgi:hypothetical protein
MLAATGFASAGCWSPVELPAPATPPQEVPGVGANLGPPAPGRQWLVLDTPGDTAHVATVTGTVTGVTSGGHAVTGAGLRDLCVTPCVADLRLGMHTLVFASDTNPGGHNRVDVQVQTDPLVVRHVIEEPAVRPVGARLLAIVGAGLLVSGAVTTAIGAAEKPMVVPGPGGMSEQPPRTAGYVGIATLAAGLRGRRARNRPQLRRAGKAYTWRDDRVDDPSKRCRYLVDPPVDGRLHSCRSDCASIRPILSGSPSGPTFAARHGRSRTGR